jgi:hypothetical protein
MITEENAKKPKSLNPGLGKLKPRFRKIKTQV